LKFLAVETENIGWETKEVKMPEFKRKPLEGVFSLTPLVVKENQEIDYDGIRSNIELLEEKGIHGFIQFGCMGQMSSVSEEEFNKVCDVAVNAAKRKKIAAVISSTETSTRAVIRRIKYAEDVGADGSMLAVPYAFPLTEELAVEFYQTVNDAIKGDIAIMVYNYPPLTEFNISPAMWKKHLLNMKNIKAIKESNGSTTHRYGVERAIADKINIFSSEGYFWHDTMLGSKGVIGIQAWVAPKVIIRCFEECRKGNQQDPWVRKVYYTVADVAAFMLSSEMPPMGSYEHGYLNALVEIGGGKAGPPRKPYARLPEAARRKLEEAVRPLVQMEKEL
jgi:4-hydroxy-tetrahydrodipicolinate synthase